jgi:hypothetical protein
MSKLSHHHHFALADAWNFPEVHLFTGSCRLNRPEVIKKIDLEKTFQLTFVIILTYVTLIINSTGKSTFIIYRLGARGIRRNITRSERLCPEGNIITEGNISPNPPRGGSINDILYRKLKASKLRIKNLTHTFVNTMFYFRINASIVAFLSNHISFGILMTTFFKICIKILKKSQVLGLKLIYSSLINTSYVLSAILLSCVLPAWSTRIMFHPMFPGEHGVEHCQK